MDSNRDTPTHNDLSALAWVQEELRKSLEASNKALHRFLAEAEGASGSDVDDVEPAILRSARQQLHQSAGALELVGLSSAAKVLRAAEAAVQRFVLKPHKLDRAAVEALERASFGLLDYLGRLLAGRQISPVALFPQYRAVQKLAGAERVHPADLWSFDWRWIELPAEAGVAPRAPDAAARTEMEKLLLLLMRQPAALPAITARMSELCAALGAQADTLQARSLWRLAAAFFQGQSQGLMPSDIYTKRVASSVLAQMNMLGRGESDVSDRLAQDLLFFCAQCTPPQPGQAPRLIVARRAYGLERFAPVSYEESHLGRFDPALVLQARKRVSGAKDSWSAVASGEMHRLHSLSEQFHLVGDSLRRIYPGGEGLADALQHAVTQTVNAKGQLEATLAMEVATSVLYLEASLEDGDFDEPALIARTARLAQRIESVRQGRPPEPLEPWMEELYRRVSDRQTMGSVVQELRASLSDAEEHIDQFFRKPEDLSVLGPVPAQLGAMRGVLSVLGMKQASQAVLRMRDDIDALIAGAQRPAGVSQEEQFHRLAGNLGALGFLIDMLNVQPNLAKNLFVFDAVSGELRPVMGRAMESEPLAAPQAQVETPPESVQAAPPAAEAQAIPSALQVAAPVAPAPAGIAAPAPAPAAVAAPAPAPAVVAPTAPVPAAVAAPAPARPVPPAAPAPAVEPPPLPVFELPPVPVPPAVAPASPSEGMPAADALAPLDFDLGLPEPAPLPQAAVAAPAPVPAPAPAPLELQLDFPVPAAPLAPAAPQSTAVPVVPAVPAAFEAPASLDLAPAAPPPAPPAVPSAVVPPPAVAPVAAPSPAGAAVPAIPMPAPLVDDEVDPEMREIFLEEAAEVVVQAGEGLEQMNLERSNADPVTVVRRAFHTLKGSARMVGLKDFGEAGWACEQLYNLWLAEQRPASKELLALTREVLDYMSAWVREIAAGTPVTHLSPPVRVAADALRLEGRLLSLAELSVPAAPVAQAVEPEPVAVAAPAVLPPVIEPPPAVVPPSFEAGQVPAGQAFEQAPEHAEAEPIPAVAAEEGGLLPELSLPAEPALQPFVSEGEAVAEPQAAAPALPESVPDFDFSLELLHAEPTPPVAAQAPATVDALLEPVPAATAEEPASPEPLEVAPVLPAADFALESAEEDAAMAARWADAAVAMEAPALDPEADFALDFPAPAPVTTGAALEPSDDASLAMPGEAELPDASATAVEVEADFDLLFGTGPGTTLSAEQEHALPAGTEAPAEVAAIPSEASPTGEFDAAPLSWDLPAAEPSALLPVAMPDPVELDFALDLPVAQTLSLAPAEPVLPEAEAVFAPLPESAAAQEESEPAEAAWPVSIEPFESLLQDPVTGFEPAGARVDVADDAGDAVSAPVLPVVEAAAAEAPVQAAGAPEAVDDLVKVIGPLRVPTPLFNIYLAEAEELSRRLCNELADWEAQPRRQMSEMAVAAAHSLAGCSATVGFSDLSQLARQLEHALIRAQAIGDGRAEEARLFREAAEEIRGLLHQFAAGFLRRPDLQLLERMAVHDVESAQRLREVNEAPIRGDLGHTDYGSLEELALEVAALEAAALDADEAEVPDLAAQAGPGPIPGTGAETVFAQPEAVHEAAPVPEPIEATPEVAFLEPALPVEESLLQEIPAPAAVEPAQAPAQAVDLPLAPAPEAPPAVPVPAPASEVAPASAAMAPPDALLTELMRPGVSALESLEPLAPVLHRAEGAARTRDIDDDIDAVDAVDPDLFPIFEEEAEELLPKLAGEMREWLEQPDERAAADACMRTLHTLKGGARLAGAMRLGELAHRLETSVERLIARGHVMAADVEPLQSSVDALSATFEALRSMDEQAYAEATAALQPALNPPPAVAVQVDAAALSDAVEAADATEALPELQDGAQAEAAAQALLPIDWSRFAPGSGAVRGPVSRAAAGSQTSVRVRAQLLDRLVGEAGEVSITRSRLESEVRNLRSSVGDLTDNLERLRQQLRDIELQAETQMATRLEAAKVEGQQFDPLEFDRFTRFQEITRMMAESVNDVHTVQRTLIRTLQTAEDELAAQARLTRELQDDLLRTRMVEFEGLFERLYRVVRQAAKESGKQVRLDIVGGSIEVDRGVLERMTGPFEHILRNSVTHGIELPEVRTAAGKDPIGTIMISLHQEGNEVTVEFRDDGAGLNLARIRAKAVASGKIAADAQLGDEEIAALIFLPGLTTAESVSELAGRGVGMDVVRSEVNAMGGRIETATAAGQGTRIRLVLPLTTAVTQVVMLRSGQTVIGVPASLIEIVRRGTLGEVARSHETGLYAVGDQNLPFFWLGALLQASGHSTEPPVRSVPVVIVRSASQRVALQVDEVLGHQEVVVKNLGPQLSRLPGLAGMTLLASGSTCLIYNPVALATIYGKAARAFTVESLAAAAQPASATPAAQAAAEAEEAVPLVLVVDDSLTVRRVTQRLLVREGYRVALAKDGLDALERLAEERPTVVLSDIEMPRMDGFDLVRNMRADAALRDLPVIMITSRIAQKHRDYAVELGVDHYLGKPYNEEELLGLIADYCRAAQRS